MIIDIYSNADWSVIGNYWLFSSGFAMVAFFAFRLQDGMTRYFSVHEALDIAEAVLFAELLTFAVLFTLTRLDGIPRSMPLVHGLLLAGGLLAARVFVRIVASEDNEPPEHQSRRERIILIGANRFASSFIQLLSVYAPQQQRVIAVLDEETAMIGRAISGVQVLGAPHELEAIVSEFAIHGIGTDRIVIAGEADFLSAPVLHEVERICKKRQIELTFLPRMLGLSERKPTTAAGHLQAGRERPDFCLAAILSAETLDRHCRLACTYRAIFPASSARRRASSVRRRSAHFFLAGTTWPQRSTFLIYKFRTLKAPFDSTGHPTAGSRRPSAVGRFLRATRLDELPQLLNVLFGEMSLIGPRPLLPEDQPTNTSLRLSVRPGISGWAQVNGAKLVTKEEKQKLDEWYVHNASLWLDLRIATMTINLLLRGRVSSQESSADTEQVQSKANGLGVASGEEWFAQTGVNAQ